MSTNIELQRDHNGQIHLVVGNEVAVGAHFAGMQPVNGEMQTVIWIPLKEATFAEVRNVIPFRRE